MSGSASGIIEVHQQLLSAMAFTVAKFCAEHREATDPDILAAIESLANTYKTLSSGIVYEQLPTLPAQKELYAALSEFFGGYEATEYAGFVWQCEGFGNFSVAGFSVSNGIDDIPNGRPRARRFIEYLRGQFPSALELKKEESRIIVP